MLQTLQNKASTPAEAVGTEIPLDALSSDVVREGYNYWLAQRGQRPFPARSDIHPAEIKRLLPHIILAKVLDGGRDFDFRIVGEAVATAHGFNAINWRVSELDRHVKGFTEVVMRVYGRVYETRRPYASHGTLKHLDRAFRGFESLFLPLGPDAQTVDHVFVVVGFTGDIDTRASG